MGCERDSEDPKNSDKLSFYLFCTQVKLFILHTVHTQCVNPHKLEASWVTYKGNRIKSPRKNPFECR